MEPRTDRHHRKTCEFPLGQQFVQAVKEEDVDGELTPTSCSSSAVDLSHLCLNQQQELEAIIPPFPEKKPGETCLVEHDIHLQDRTPIRQRMYRILERLLPVLKEELMLELGVIAPSTSEWSNPVVLVVKKDGSIYFCIDFQKVNTQCLTLIHCQDWMSILNGLINQSLLVQLISVKGTDKSLLLMQQSLLLLSGLQTACGSLPGCPLDSTEHQPHSRG